MKKLVIVGSGELGKQFKHMIDNYSEDEVVGWIDDTKKKGDVISNVEVIGGINELTNIKSRISITVAIGYRHSRFKVNLIEKLKSNSFIELYTYVHPSAFVDKSAKIEPGVFIYPNATIDMGVNLESGVIINNSSVISHDSKISECVFIAPNATISGNVLIGKGCFIGAGSVVKDGVVISNYNTIGSGTNVYKNISEEGGTYITKANLIKLI